ncbi:MAG: TraB/GumN family protein [Bacteroidetes bacterium]|nr:TraB/GumN family protein [Bacteroidota bacterium]
MKCTFILLLFCILSISVAAQNSNPDNHIFWKISGNGLVKPSYLFGTYHILSNSFVDSIPAVTAALSESDAVAGELVLDSNTQSIVSEAALLHGTSLKKLLPDSLYSKADSFFTHEAGFPLSALDQMNPLAITAIALLVIQQKYFPNPAGDTPMDSYFQQMAKQAGKALYGLETAEDQVDVLFRKTSMDRQVELMTETFFEKQDMKEMIAKMNYCYRSENLVELEKLMYDGTYTPGEILDLLENRNENWVERLPALMADRSLFVAVGALHLPGEHGLVNLLRSKGYTLTPVDIVGLKK